MLRTWSANMASGTRMHFPYPRGFEPDWRDLGADSEDPGRILEISEKFQRILKISGRFSRFGEDLGRVFGAFGVYF